MQTSDNFPEYSPYAELTCLQFPEPQRLALRTSQDGWSQLYVKLQFCCFLWYL